MRIICDFDGTISLRDTTDLVLETLADPAWQELEDDWLTGRITAATCMRAQIAMVGGDAKALDALLDTVELDTGFHGFVAWCGARGLPISVVSDGVDYFIRRVLQRHGIAHLPVVANRLAGAPGARRLEQPWSREGCASGSGVCKCAAAGAGARETADTIVFVGDGRSDFCLSGRVDLLFAKGALAEYAAARAQPFIPFDNFDDVTAALSALFFVPAASRANGL